MSQTIQIPQGSIPYRASGDGSPIVFVHGLLVDGRLWDGLLPHLPGHRLIVPDWPLGSHRSALRADADLTPPGLAAIVAAGLDALDVHDVTLVANDTGGAIAQLVVTRHPDRIARLVLTNCDAYENFLPPMFRPLQVAARIPGAAWAIAQALRSPRVRNLPMAYGRLSHAHLDDALTADWLAPVQTDPGVRRDVIKILRGIAKRYTEQAALELRRFERPVLIAWGRDDPFFKPRYAERLAADCASARLEWIDGSRAFVPIDAPAALGALIAEFAGKPLS